MSWSLHDLYMSFNRTSHHSIMFFIGHETMVIASSAFSGSVQNLI